MGSVKKQVDESYPKKKKNKREKHKRIRT